MNQLTKGLIACFLIAATFTLLPATSYLTIASGNYNDATEVWSTDGVSPCLCTPPTTLTDPLDSLFIRHDLLSVSAITISGGGHMAITAAGSFSSPATLRIDGGSLANAGALTADAIQVVNSAFASTGTVEVSTGSFLNIASTTDITGYMHVGLDFRVFPGATFILRSNSTLVVSGFFFNLGMTITEPGSCINVAGDFFNPEIGDIVGGGHISADFNVTNYGGWDPATTWCAGVAGYGLPTPPNCITCGPLPIELAAFEAILDPEDGTVELRWTTTAELNNDHFTLERSSNGLDYEPIATVPSQSHNGQGMRYARTDPSPRPGINYYRLGQVDRSGKSQSLRTEWVHASGASGNALQLFPNPSAGPLNFQLSLQTAAKFSITVTDLSGQTVRQEAYPEATLHRGQLDLGELAKGIYLVRIQAGTFSHNQKIALR